MQRTIPALVLLGTLALAACNEDDTTGAPAETVPDIAVSDLGTTSWPPANALRAAVDVGGATDPLADNVMVVLDMSGSMARSGCSGQAPNRAEAAKGALLDWISANPADNTGLVSFSAKGLETDLGLGQGTAHAEALVERIRTLQADGGTPLRSAMDLAAAELERQAAAQGGTGTYRLIVVTDGQANSGEDPRPLVRAIAANPANMIEIHTIGFCIDGGHALNDPQRVFYTDATSPEELRAGLDATLGEAADFDLTEFEEITP